MVEIIRRGELPITVNKEIVSHLSLGLYRNFARAIKELVSNAYDADATEVKIKLDLNKKRIIVRDNGKGMNLEEIKDRFLSIGHPTPPSNKLNKLGRERIGSFGIGCLSVFPYCEELQVITKRKGSNKLIEFNIKTFRFFDSNSRVSKINLFDEKVPYEEYDSDISKDVGETIITLKNIKTHLLKDLKEKGMSNKSSIERFGGYEKFKWTLKQYLPLQFPKENKDLRDFFSVKGRIPLRVWLDGKELFRNVPLLAKILEKGEKSFGKVKVKYILMSPMKPVEPQEAKGIQIRVKDVAIGLPRDFDVTKKGRVLARLNYLYGEAAILEGLNNDLMVNRDSFSYTQDVFEMEEFFRGELTKWANKLDTWAKEDKDIYGALIDIKGSEEIIKELKESGVLRLPKERLRLSKIQKSLSEKESPSEQIKKALSKSEKYQILINEGTTSKNKFPVRLDKKKKTIIIEKDHPSFLETLNLGKKEFLVSYDEWNYKEQPYTICKLVENRKKVVFNTKNPIFQTKINEETIKRLSLGFLLLSEEEDNEKLLAKLNILLETVFKE